MSRVPPGRVARPDEGDPARRDVAPCQARKHQHRRHCLLVCGNRPRHRRSTTTACCRYHRLWVTLIAIPRSRSSSSRGTRSSLRQKWTLPLFLPRSLMGISMQSRRRISGRTFPRRSRCWRAPVCAWLGGNFARERQLDGHPSSACEVVGLEAEADRVPWSRPRQLPPAVDLTPDPMLVEVAIQVPPPDRHSASELGHVVEMATIMVEDPPSDVQPTSTSPREKFLASPSSLAAEFAKQVLALLKTSLIKAAPLRQKRRSPSSACSIRLAAKCGSRATNATLQAQKVLTAKWDPNPQPSRMHLLRSWLLLNRLYRSHLILQSGQLCASR
jgi:hypothetical protein